MAWTRTARRTWRLVDLGRVSATREVRVADESVTATISGGLANGKVAIRHVRNGRKSDSDEIFS